MSSDEPTVIGRRLELLRMLGDMLIRPVDYLITHDWSRLVDVRKAEEFRVIKQTAEESGTEIVTVNGQLDEVPAGSLLNVLMDTFGRGDDQRSAA